MKKRPFVRLDRFYYVRFDYDDMARAKGVLRQSVRVAVHRKALDPYDLSSI
jgi:hypothetical protein